LARAGEPPLRWSRRAGGVVPDADVVVLAVRDEAIAEVGAQVMAALAQPPILLHCAGALGGREPFAGLSPRGAALLHPLRSFAGGSDDVPLFGTVFGIEGDDTGVEAAREIVARVGGVPLLLDAAQLGRYHAAAALVSNGTVGLVDAGAALLESVGLGAAQARTALTSLLSSTTHNLEQAAPAEALTGPIARGDSAVVARHLQLLPPELQSLYRAVMRRVLAVSAVKGRASPEALAAIGRLLDDG
jgi:predicted short-subunit dehydrogenase-like oxidoreductase (DUF2520 family)